MLLEARRRSERLATFRARVGPGTDVLGSDVPLQVTGVCEHLLGEGTTHTGKLLSASTCSKECTQTDTKGMTCTTRTGHFASRVMTLPLSSFHIRSACHCHVTSDVGSSLISSWRPWGIGRICILSPQSGTECGLPDYRQQRKCFIYQVHCQYVVITYYFCHTVG